ncbi:hypothetical protein GCM10027447_12290 [Glycomyces halotolerans]
MTTKPCVICGADATVELPTEPGVCSAACFYTLEAEVDRPIAGEVLTGDTLAEVLAAEKARRR